MNFINKDLVVSTKPEAEAEVYTLIKGTHLGEVIDRLPAGIIDKSVTGIGATTLEIDSPRDSIIVVPLKAIAYTKFKKHTGTCYVGGPIGKTEGLTDQEIKSYHQSNITPKKYLVVADSLPRLFRVLGEKDFFNCFLMIDEVDSFQLDSFYREKLEDCLDYYKMFPKSNRALVSGTMMGFSDPELQEESKTVFKYDVASPRTIEVFSTENVLGAAVDHINMLQNTDPTQKIVVAYNSVDGSKAIAEKLIKNFKVNPDSIRLLCSSKREEDARPFYGELINGILPGNINFITSAYFVGIDINEPYHSIAICNPKLKQTLLSVNRLKQIAGRCRERGLLSESIFYSPTHLDPDDIIPIHVLLQVAEKKIKSLDCITDNFQSDEILKKQILEVRKLITGKADVLDYSLVRTNLEEKHVPSFFNIDACYETMNILKSLYSSIDALPNALARSGEDPIWKERRSYTKVEHKSVDSAKEKSELHEQAITKLRALDRPEDVKQLLITSKNRTETEMFQRYQELYEYYSNEDSLIEVLKELAPKNKKAYDLFVGKKKASHDSLLRTHIIELFPKGSKHTRDEILKKLNLANAKAGTHTTFESGDVAIQNLKTYFDVYKNKREIKDGQPLHEIKGLLYEGPPYGYFFLKPAERLDDSEPANEGYRTTYFPNEEDM